MIKQICQTQYSKDPQYMIDLFLAITSRSVNCPLAIEQIKSVSVFPEIVTEDNKSILYWDMQYWEFFDYFLLELSYFIENENYKERFIQHILALYYDYLSLKLVHIPELAYCIQVNRERKFGTPEKEAVNPEKFQVIGSNFESGIFYSRFIVFFHEFFHFYYKLNPNKKVEDCSRLNKMAKYYGAGDIFFHQKSDMDDLLMEGVQALLYPQDDKLLEETSCDYRALIETVSIWNELTNSMNKNFSAEFHKIHDSFHISQTFLSYLTNIFVCWEALYKAYICSDSQEKVLKNIQPYFDKAAHMAIIRNSIIPDFLDKLNMKKYGIESYVNILNKDYVKNTLQNISDKIIDPNFMFYAIKEAKRLTQLPHYNPLELKDIVLSNAGYRVSE